MDKGSKIALARRPAPFFTVDVFTDQPFGGNQLAVFPDASKIPVELFQSIAREFNYSETTFVLPPLMNENAARVRIFTPLAELPFAGHPTIGTAFVLAYTGALPLSGDLTETAFEELSGEVKITIRADDGNLDFVYLTAPELPVVVGPAPTIAVLAQVLLLETDSFDHLSPAPAVVSGGTPFLLVPVKDVDALSRCRIHLENYNRLVHESGINKIFVYTHNKNDRQEICARMFAPAIGIPEDPATGSAAVALGGYLAEHESLTDETLHWTIHQGIQMGRPSTMFVEAEKRNGDVQFVRVGGKTVLISEGQMSL